MSDAKTAARQRAYREKNLEKFAARQRAYYARNREKLTARQRAYYARNREKLTAHGITLQQRDKFFCEVKNGQ